MKSLEYAQWIAAYVDRQQGKVAGRCASASAGMAMALPELRVAKGWCYSDHGILEHCWCVAPDGAIVDPTAEQFTGISGYEEWQPGDEVQVGRCMNCGTRIYEAVEKLEEAVEKLEGVRKSICSESCAKELLDSMQPSQPRRQRRPV